MPAKVKSGNTPKVKVTVGGQELPKHAVRRVSVDRAVNMADMFTLDLLNDRCSMSDNASLEPGKPVQIEMGYQEGGGKFTRVLVGQVVALKGIFPRRGPMGLRVHGYDPSQLLTQGRKTRRFKGPITYAKVAETVLADDRYKNKLIVKAEDTKDQHEYVFQRNQTDMEFLMELAGRVGYECSVSFHDSDANAPALLTFGPPKLDGGSVRTFKKGENLLSFVSKSRVSLAPTGVTVMSWNPDEWRVIMGEAKGGDSPEDKAAKGIGEFIEEVHEFPVRTQSEADKLAKSVMQSRGLEFIRAEAVFAGNPDLIPGTIVQLEGVGALFSRTYYVTRVIHDIHDTGFNSRVELKSVTVSKVKPQPPPKPTITKLPPIAPAPMKPDLPLEPPFEIPKPQLPLFIPPFIPPMQQNPILGLLAALGKPPFGMPNIPGLGGLLGGLFGGGNPAGPRIANVRLNYGGPNIKNVGLVYNVAAQEADQAGAGQAK